MPVAKSYKLKNRQKTSVCIAVDIMGSDSSPEVLFEGVLYAAETLKDVATFQVLASQEAINHFKSLKNVHLKSSICFCPVSEWITMDDSVLAVRRKKQSSLVKGVHLVQKQEVDALVSAGNTGAFIVAAKTYLQPLAQITRPALLTLFPTKKGVMVVIDVGGTLSPKAEDLVQYASMGVAFQNVMFDKKKPKVGLLNIGTEYLKGTETLRKAFSLLQENARKVKKQPFTFLGNREGRDLFQGHIDVLVTDGFSGNVFLKTAEGLFSYLYEELQLLGVGDRYLSSLKEKFSYEEYPGGIILGVNGLLVKCHGNSSSQAMQKAIEGAVYFAQKNVIEGIINKLVNNLIDLK